MEDGLKRKYEAAKEQQYVGQVEREKETKRNVRCRVVILVGFTVLRMRI